MTTAAEEIAEARRHLDSLDALIFQMSEDLRGLSDANETSGEGPEDRMDKKTAIDFHKKNLAIKKLTAETVRSISKICLDNQVEYSRKIDPVIAEYENRKTIIGFIKGAPVLVKTAASIIIISSAIAAYVKPGV